MAVRTLFVSSVYEASIASERGFEAFNGDLQDACGMLAEEDRAGRAYRRLRTNSATPPTTSPARNPSGPVMNIPSKGP